MEISVNFFSNCCKFVRLIISYLTEWILIIISPNGNTIYENTGTLQTSTSWWNRANIMWDNSFYEFFVLDFIKNMLYPQHIYWVKIIIWQ